MGMGAVSILRCPHCGYSRAEMMPEGACQFFYECTNCRMVLRPKPGDCCVFCSYGSVGCQYAGGKQGCGGC